MMDIVNKIITILNPLVGVILRSPLHGLMSGNTMLLTFRGRKTGKEYTTPVSYLRTGGVVRVFTESDWWKNCRNDAPVTLLIAGDTVEGRANAITGDPEKIATAIAEFLQHIPRDAPFYGIKLGADGKPPEDQLAAAAGKAVMIDVTV